MKLTEETAVLGEKPVSVLLLYTTQIPRGLTWDRTLDFTLRNQQLTP
jgi:hypothetical protein